MRRLAATLVVGTALALFGGAQSAAAQEADGAAVYREDCRKCHGATGTPSSRIAGMYPEMKPLSELSGVSADSLVSVLTNGVGDMKSFKDKLSAAEMEAVAKYVLTLGKKES